MFVQLGFCALPRNPTRLPSVAARLRYAPGAFSMDTVSECVVAWVIEAPFERFWRMISPTAVTFDDKVSVVPLPWARNRLPLVATRPPKLKSDPAKKLRSVDENIPNWNTGMA